MPLFRNLFFLTLLYTSTLVFSQGNDSLRVSEINLTGNKVTKSYIILRELDFQKGDYLNVADLEARLLQNQNQIFNTRLFNKVTVTSVTTVGSQVQVHIEVAEKWYVWPYPVLIFADRNFNIWWETKDLGRLNAGLNVYDYNFRGRAEKLKIRTLVGYTRLFMVDYEIPYIDKEKKKGLQLEFAYQSNKEVWLKAENNRLQFLFDPNQRAIRHFGIEASFLYRPKIFTRHQFKLGWEDVLVSDTVLHPEQNPDFLAGQRSRQMSIKFFYTFKYDRRDIAYYPLKGHFIEFNAEPRYLIEDKSVYADLRVNAEKFLALGAGFYAGAGIRGKISFPEKQPYNLYQSLGYKFFVRGFEPYVIDGQHYGLIETNIKYCLYKKDIELPLIRMGQFKKAPTAVYVTAYTDGGYVSSSRFAEPGNTYQNTWLQGYGLGLDFVTYYDRVVRVEYSLNAFGRKGLYLHFTAPI